MNANDKVSVRGAAAESGMSVPWWRKMIRLKRVPYYKVGRRILISRRDIQALLKAARVEPEGHEPDCSRPDASADGPVATGEVARALR